jgi:hypothetical protein
MGIGARRRYTRIYATCHKVAATISCTKIALATLRQARVAPRAELPPCGAGLLNILEWEAMRTWLRSLVDAIVGKVPGKTSRLATATRMAMDADFSHRREPGLPEPSRKRKRDDRHLVKPLDPSADNALFEQLVRIVNEAQERDSRRTPAL